MKDNMFYSKVKAKLVGKQLYVEEEDISDLADVEESFVDKAETSVENEEEEEKKEDPTNITKEGRDNDEKVDNELPDDDFFAVQPNKSGKIQKAVEDPQKTMVEAEEENPDEVIDNFFDKPMMAQKAQMKIKRKLAKISK